ncbi:MAG TPA: hypothetical protein VEW25_07465 [Allosphingosinicella sp.]|nr:hypothetical protein [Allosphingosinicella sp.]
MRAGTILLGALALLAACAAPQQDVSLERAFAGQSQVSGSALDRRIAAAAAHPLGSRNNPVRAEMPIGERAYLQRLRCSDGRTPAFERIGNFGLGVYGNIIDGYRVACGDAQPGQVEIYMDMYHRGHVEDRPVPGFTIVPSPGSI